MSRKRFSSEKIISILREAEVLQSQGMTIGEVSRKLCISEQTYYCWRKDYGGMRIDQARRLKDLEREKTASINYSSPEKSFLSIALAEMAKRYSLPSLVADAGWGDYTEACVSGVLTPATQLTGIMGGSDLVTGLGSIDSAKGISFEQFIVDSYMWDCCKNYLNEVEISEEKIGLDAVKDVGHGHNFLTHPHTLRYLRGELTFWEGEKLDLLEMDDKDVHAEANRIVKSILDKHQVEPLANDLIEKGDAIIAKYEDIVGH